MARSTYDSWAGLVQPGKGAGLLDVYHRRYLLLLLVRKELRVRYHGSVLGLLWSYVKPAVQFAVFFYAMGEFLKLRDMLQPYAVYLFAGMVVINLFSETFMNATRSVVDNGALVKKIYLPRELFPVASYIVALVHFVPQIVILTLGALFTGWDPTWQQVATAFIGFSIVSIMGIGLGLAFGAINVALRDIQNIVDLVLMVAVWVSPVLYSWHAVRDALGDGWQLTLYQINPLTVAVELFHMAFWYGQADHEDNMYSVPPDIWLHTGIALAIAILSVVAGQLIFRRLEGRFAQEL